MESTSCMIADMEAVTVETLPITRLVPWLMITANPIPARNRNGSIQDSHITSRMIRMAATPQSRIHAGTSGLLTSSSCQAIS